MAKLTAKSKAPKKPLSEALRASRKMAQINWQLEGQLKCNRIAYLKVARLLAQVREEKLHKAWQHDTIESYALEHLKLDDTSLYDYLNAYDWVRVNRPQWLQPKPKGFIPKMSDIEALVSIDERLAKPGLQSTTKARLEELRKKALDGRLTKREFEAFKRRSVQRAENLSALLATLSSVRRRATRVSNFPAEALKTLDTTIELVRNQQNLRVAGLHGLGSRIRALLSQAVTV